MTERVRIEKGFKLMELRLIKQRSDFRSAAFSAECLNKARNEKTEGVVRVIRI